MRIVTPGEIKHGFEGPWECTDCGCQWVMDATDPKPAQSSDQRDGGSFHMPCPTCKREVYRRIPRSPQYGR